MKKKHLYIILIFFTLTQCEKESFWQSPAKKSFIVVDAIITNENAFQKITIHRNKGILNQEDIPISQITVELKTNNTSVFFNEDVNNQGTYISEIPFAADTGIVYRLVLNYENQYDTAEAIMATIEKIDPLTIVEHGEEYRVLYSESNKASMMDVEYNWTANVDYCINQSECLARETFYTVKSIEILSEFAPKKQIISFPRKTNITRTKYSLSREHEEFIRSLLIETEWRGGLFDVEQGNVPTNFSNGVMGWFAVCMVERDTLVFD